MRLELGVDPLPGDVPYALARALMAQSKGQYGYLQYIFRQCFPTSADDETFWVWASTFGVDQKPAGPWQGVARFTGTDTTVIAAGTVIVRSDGETYTTDAVATVGSVTTGLVDVSCTAVNAGTSADNDDLQPLDLQTPISGVDTESTVQSTTTAGVDVETAEEGLVRLLSRLRQPPSGGGPGDYVRWALEVDGVTRAWEFANLYGPNTVGVAFVRDNDGTGSAIVPDAGERAAVQAYLNSVAPITVAVTVITLTALTVPVTLSALNPNTSAVQAAISTSVEDFLRRESAPGGTLELSRFDAAISLADGEISHTMTAPAAAVTSTTAQIPVLGTVTFP